MSYAAQVKSANIGYFPLHIPRHALAGFSETFVIVGEDLTGSSVSAQIRLLPDSSGDPLADFTIGTLTLDDGNTLIPVSLTQAQTKALPAAGETGQQVVLYWDLWIDGEVWLAAEVYVIGGINQ